jgi:hypothetical protein
MYPVLLGRICTENVQHKTRHTAQYSKQIHLRTVYFKLAVQAEETHLCCLTSTFVVLRVAPYVMSRVALLWRRLCLSLFFR